MWVSCACCWPSVLQLVSLAFFCFILHRIRIILNGGNVLIAIYGINLLSLFQGNSKEPGLFVSFSFVGPAVAFSFSVLFAHVGAAAAAGISSEAESARGAAALREVQILDPCVCRCFCYLRPSYSIFRFSGSRGGFSWLRSLWLERYLLCSAKKRKRGLILRDNGREQHHLLVGYARGERTSQPFCCVHGQKQR